MLIALTRAVPASIADCQLTHIDRVPIDVAVARAQHEEYERALESLGCTIVRVATADELPDSVFVEDIAVVTDETAVITRPGAESRRAETAGVVEVLRRYRELRFIEAPGTIDGGDVLRIADRVFAGLSSRTNREGIRQLGLNVQPIEVRGALHLKSAVTQIGENTVLINRDWVGGFDDYEQIEVHPDEPFAANALRVGDALIYSTSFPRTLERLKNYDVRTVDASELAKAEGGVTCCSVILSRADGEGPVAGVRSASN
jgi:dimethylargininase